GIYMRITQYGYRDDPYMDTDTLHGRGAYHGLRKESAALTGEGLAALGLTVAQVRQTNPWIEIKFKGGGVLQRPTDDRAPEHLPAVDLYQPGGFNGGLPDYGDVSLIRGPV